MSAATKTIYCKMAQSWWKADGAAVGAYYWGTGSGPEWPGVRMTPVAGETDLWSIDIDTDKFQNIIFTRVNGSGAVSDWGAKTADLTVPADDKNLYTITSTTPVWGNPGVTGTWSVYAPDAPKTYKDIIITVVANATPKIHYWEGGDKVIGTEWETKPEMVATGEANTYSYTIKEVDEAIGVKYLVVVGEVQSADQQTFENVTANFKDLLPQVALMGVTGWTGDKMTVADDYLSASITLPLEATKDYEIKLTVNGEWFGSNAIVITKDNNSALFDTNGEGNGKLTTDLAGDYVFTYTYANKTLVVTYPTPVVDDPVVELPAASVRAWAYDLALAVEGEQYTFSYKATTAAKATLIFTDAEGVELAIVDLGEVEAGANSKVLAATELPVGKKVNWAVKLEAGAVTELVEVTDQTRGIYDFYNMMDVLVDNNPESEHFGKIYIQMAYNGASDGATDRADVQTAGLFIYDQELNELNDPSNVGIKPTLPEGYTMGDNRNKFHRLEIDPKTGKLAYCYNIAGSPAVFAIDRANLTGEVENLIAGVEGLNQTCALAFDEEGTLYVMNLASSAGAIYKIVDGQAVAMFEPTGKFVNASMSMAADGMGGLWIAQNRGQIDTYYQLAHVTKDGELDYTVFSGNNPDNLTGSSSRGALVYDAERQLLAQGRNGKVEVYSVAYNAETGVPALTLVATTPSVGTNIDGLAFDYAGDLYVVNSSKEKFQKFAMPTDNNVCTTPAAAKYAFEVGGATTPVELVGTVKRAVQNGDEVIVLTHEADGAAHIYQVVDGKVVAEVSQEGVIARDPENAGDLLAISDIAVTDDGKLVAINYMQTQSGDDYVDAGYKRGETRVYLWNDLAGDPAILFTSKMSSNWFRSKQGLTMAVKGTSDNMEIFTTGIHATKAWARTSSYRVIEGVYVEPDVNNNDYYHFYDVADAVALETTVGTQYELNASPLGAMNWILDAELINPVEIVEPETNNVEISTCVALTQDLGKKYQGVSVVTVGEQVLMVAPYATAEGLLAGVKVLDITAGLDAATEVATADLDAAVEATAAATAVAVAENVLTITLVADATLYTLEVVLEEKPDYMSFEDEITNLVIDLESMAIMGGPSTMWQVEVFLGLAEDDNMDGQWSLSPESSVAIMGFDARLIDGYVYDIDVNAPAAKAVLYVEDSGFFYEFKLNMTSTPTEAIVVVVEDATVQIDTVPLFGDQVDYALTMTANWTYAEDGLTYPVLVEVPVYYPEATEPSEMTCTVTIGGMGDTDPWLGFGEGTLTITTVDGVVTAKGIVANPYTGVAFDVTVSGKLPVEEPIKYTVTATVNPAEAGTVEGAGEYEENAEATLTATPNEGYEFVNWTVAGEEVATDATYTFTVTADVELVANFKVIDTSVDNINTTATSVKMIKNGKLIIVKDGVEYDAQGAILK